MILDFFCLGDYPQDVALEFCLLFYEIPKHSKRTKGVIDAKGCVFILFYVHAFMCVNLISFNGVGCQYNSAKHYFKLRI